MARPILLASLGTLCLLASTAAQRTLQQADGPGDDLYNLPDNLLSATPADLQNDPSGRSHLLARLGNPSQYFANYAYTRPVGEFAIDPKIDPNVVNNIPGNSSPQNGTFTVVGNSGMIAVHAVPFPNGEVLLFGRQAEPFGGGDPAGPLVQYLTVEGGNWTEIAAIYDTKTNTYEPFHIPEAPFCGAQTILPDGRAIIIGGSHVNTWYPYLQYGSAALRIYDPTTHTIETVNYFDRARWYPSLATMPDGNILIIGGGQQEIGGWGVSGAASSAAGLYEKQYLIGACVPNNGASAGDPYYDNPSYTIYNPATNTLTPSLTLTILLEAFPINLYPYLTVLPSGSFLIVTGVNIGAMFLTPNGAIQDKSVGKLPKLPYPVGPNQYTPVAVLALEPPNYRVQILVAGGTSVFCPNVTSPANDKSYLIDVSPGANHSIVTEQLAYRRLMGDLTHLPDGRLFLCNGAQVGTGGGGGPRYSNMDKPTTVAEIYDPSQPVGQRWKPVGDTQIPRLYHSVAFLTANATVLIAGSETTSDRRVQIWTPDYLLTGKPRPNITNAPTTLAYNGTGQVSFSGVSSVDRVVLIRPGSPTHGLHFDERLIVLNFTASGQTLTITAPPTPNIAIPGQYMLFILSQGVPSMAAYVTIPLSSPSPAQAPVSPLSTYGTVLSGGITGPVSVPLAAEAPQGPTISGNITGTNGKNSDDFATAPNADATSTLPTLNSTTPSVVNTTTTDKTAG